VSTRDAKLEAADVQSEEKRRWLKSGESKGVAACAIKGIVPGPVMTRLKFVNVV
jgi:hypothetical protein